MRETTQSLFSLSLPAAELYTDEGDDIFLQGNKNNGNYCPS